MRTPQYREGYYGRANTNIALFETTGEGQHLIYAALELRMAIERLLFQYLTLLDTNLRSSPTGLYQVKNLKARILKLEPYFLSKIDFVNLYFQAFNNPTQFAKPDLDTLNRLYGKLGGYLHTVNDAEKTIGNKQWWKNMVELLHEASAFLKPIVSLPTVDYKLNEAGRRLFKDFHEGKRTSQEVIAIFRASNSTTNK